jgi:putative FmdB family regulatory protein
MPTYEYKCPKCGHEFEKIQKISDDTRPKCPKCGTRAVRVISGGIGVSFKGSGFYETDYKRAGESKKSSDEGSKTESKPDAKTEKSDKPAEKAATKSTEKPADQPKKKPGAES